MIKKFLSDQLKVKIYRTPEIVGQQAAFECFMRVRDLLLEQDEVTVVFVCSEEMVPMYKELSKLQDAGWDKVNAFFLYSGMSQPDKTISKMIEKLKFGSCVHIGGTTKNLQTQSDKLRKKFQKDELDIVCVPLKGRELGGLYSGSEQEEESELVKMVGQSSVVFTLAALKCASYIYAIAQGKHNRDGAFEVVRGNAAKTCPASILRHLDHATLYCDKDAGERLIVRKSVITDEISEDFETALSFAKEHEIEGVELRWIGEKPAYEADLQEKKKMKALLEQYQLKVTCIASWIFRCELEQSEIDRNLDMLKQAVSFAKEFGAPYLRIYSFLAKGDFSKVEDDIIEVLKAAALYAKQNGVVLVLENEASVYATNGEMTSTLVKKIGMESMRCLWDPCNNLLDPDNETPYPTGYQFVKNHYTHMHLKDAEKSGGELNPVPLGEGEEYDIQSQLKGILLEGYDGFVSLEGDFRHNLSYEYGQDSRALLEENLTQLHDMLMEVIDEM